MEREAAQQTGAPHFGQDRLSLHPLVWDATSLEPTPSYGQLERDYQTDQEGGLGVRWARQQNISLLGKLAWELLQGPMKLWSQVLTDIYLHGGSLFDSHHKRGSTTWNSILKAFKHLEDGFSFKVGDGQTSFWFTLWLCEEPLYALVPFVDIHDPGLLICDVWENRTW